MDKEARKVFRKVHGGSLTALIGHSGSSSFDYSQFKEQAGKKNFGENLSRHLAVRFASALSHWFQGILPDAEGRGQESRARTSKGYKKLDVNYSTAELGLGLGVSIKTINAIDRGSKRYTKNYTRVDAELRAEAADYHERQPYATMVAVIFLPLASCMDGSEKDPSSFGAAIRMFRHRAGREKANDSHMLFERVFIGLYDTEPATLGDTLFLDVMTPPPWRGKPTEALTFDAVIKEIVSVYDSRNNPAFTWASGEALEISEAPFETADDSADDDDEE
jgi:hypothetical protein